MNLCRWAWNFWTYMVEAKQYVNINGIVVTIPEDGWTCIFLLRDSQMHRGAEGIMKKISIFLWTSETAMNKRKWCWQGEQDDRLTEREHPNSTLLLGNTYTASGRNKLLKNRFYYGRRQRWDHKLGKRFVTKYGGTKNQEVATLTDFADMTCYWHIVFIS